MAQRADRIYDNHDERVAGFIHFLVGGKGERMLYDFFIFFFFFVKN